MRRLRRLGLGCAIAGLLGMAACSSGATCSDILDSSGRPIVLCPARHVAVCNLPGEEARFENEGAGLQLIGGLPAGCSTDFEVVCPSGTEGDPFCIVDPEL